MQAQLHNKVVQTQQSREWKMMILISFCNLLVASRETFLTMEVKTDTDTEELYMHFSVSIYQIWLDYQPVFLFGNSVSLIFYTIHRSNFFYFLFAFRVSAALKSSIYIHTGYLLFIFICYSLYDLLYKLNWLFFQSKR